MTVHTEAAPQPHTYSINSGGTGGIWLGLGTARVALLGIGLLAAILMMTAGSAPWLALTPILTALLITAARVGGRPALDWVAPFIGHRRDAFSGTTRWRSALPTLPRPGAADGVRLSLPAEFGRLRVMTCPDDPSIGMIIDAATKTLTVSFEVCGVDRFSLLDCAERDALIAGWGDALSVLADTDESLSRLQLSERALALAADPYPSEPDRDDPADWRADIAAFATAHETRLAAQWTFGKVDSTALSVIAARCQLVCRTLVSARLVARPLSTSEVISEMSSMLTGQPTRDGHLAERPGPLSRRSEWTHVVLDERLHRAFAISGWPSAPVGAAWMSPLLLAAPDAVARTVSLHLERVVPAAAARVARSRRAKATLDQADRARFGMTSSAALDNAQASGVAMDTELAAGYRTHRLAGLVTLSGETIADLDEASRVLRQAAAVCRIELRPLHGQHASALASTAPLCRLRPRGQA
jgi:hypothetical protein